MNKNRLIRFLIIGASIFVIWFLLYHVWIDPETMDKPIIHVQTKASYMLLTGIGQPVHVHASDGKALDIIYLNHKGVSVGGECGGMELFILFTGFIVAFGGQVKKMLWFIPAGILIIIMLNVIRISTLTMMVAYAPSYVDFNHKYTFVIIVYGVIFGMWVLWTKRYAGLHKSSS